MIMVKLQNEMETKPESSDSHAANAISEIEVWRTALKHTLRFHHGGRYLPPPWRTPFFLWLGRNAARTPTWQLSVAQPHEGPRLVKTLFPGPSARDLFQSFGDRLTCGDLGIRLSVSLTETVFCGLQQLCNVQEISVRPLPIQAE